MFVCLLCMLCDGKSPKSIFWNALCRRCWACQLLFTTAAKTWAIFTGAVNREITWSYGISQCQGMLWNVISPRVWTKYLQAVAPMETWLPIVWLTEEKWYLQWLWKFCRFFGEKFFHFLPDWTHKYIWSCLAVINCKSPLNSNVGRVIQVGYF